MSGTNDKKSLMKVEDRRLETIDDRRDRDIEERRGQGRDEDPEILEGDWSIPPKRRRGRRPRRVSPVEGGANIHAGEEDVVKTETPTKNGPTLRAWLFPIIVAFFLLLVLGKFFGMFHPLVRDDGLSKPKGEEKIGLLEKIFSGDVEEAPDKNNGVIAPLEYPRGRDEVTRAILHGGCIQLRSNETDDVPALFCVCPGPTCPISTQEASVVVHIPNADGLAATQNFTFVVSLSVKPGHIGVFDVNAQSSLSEYRLPGPVKKIMVSDTAVQIDVGRKVKSEQRLKGRDLVVIFPRDFDDEKEERTAGRP